MVIVFSSLLRATATVGTCTTVARSAAPGLLRWTRAKAATLAASTSAKGTTTGSTTNAAAVSAFALSQNKKERSDAFNLFNLLEWACPTPFLWVL